MEILDKFPQKEIFIIPIRLDNCKLVDDKLQKLQRVDLFPSYENGLNQILRVLAPDGPDVFVSYALLDHGRVLKFAEQLKSFGINVWLDERKIRGSTNFRSEIVKSIKGCRVLILMCSNASMRSKHVKQELQLAWKYERPYLPLLLESIDFPEQVE